MSDIWTVQRILKWTVDYFTSHNISEPRLSAELLLAHVLQSKRLELYLQFERILTVAERADYRALVKRRMKREPVQYILGETEFMGLPFQLSPAVLIPRPDTEILVDTVREWLETHPSSSPRILDIGTGSGCIAISLAKQFPAAQVWAIEKSGAALEVARENARLNQVEIHFLEGDFFQQFPNRHPFEVVVSNPPYISQNDWQEVQPEVRQFEPAEALLSGAEGLDFYRRLVPRIGELLPAEGAVFLETGYDQARRVAEMLAESGLRTRIRADLNEIERVVVGEMPGSE